MGTPTPQPRRARDDFVEAARASDRSQTSWPPEPPLPRTSVPDEIQLREIIDAARQRSPSSETGHAG
jgi:hypothetical protein